VQILTINAATGESAQALYRALSPFQPELDSDEQGAHSVSVELGSDKRVVEVLDAIQLFLAGRAAGTVTSSLTVALDGHDYTLHG